MSMPKDRESGLTLEALRAAYSYDPVTGFFQRRKRVNQAGERVGWLNPITGYLIITVNGRRYMAHRIAWFYVHGVWPKDRLDHANGDNSNNGIDNLREAGDQENARNRGTFSNCTSGVKGVRLHESGKYQCRIFDGIKFRTRTFETLEEAKAEHERMSREVFGEFARVA